VDDLQYTDQFAEVHRKAKVFKDLLREANKHDAELRESRQVGETKEPSTEMGTSEGLAIANEPPRGCQSLPDAGLGFEGYQSTRWL